MITLLVVLAAALASPVAAADMSRSLTLEDARKALAGAGGLVGKVFIYNGGRYAVTRSAVPRVKRPNVFEVEVEIVPLPRVVQ